MTTLKRVRSKFQFWLTPLIRQIHHRQEQQKKPTQLLPINPKDKDSITWAIRFFLGRNPLNQNEINFHSAHDSFESLRTAFCQTAEFKAFYQWANQEDSPYRLPLFLLPNHKKNAKPPNWLRSHFSPPSLLNLSSQLCTHDQFHESVYQAWCREIMEEPCLHRKQWEYVWILAAMAKAGLLTGGSRALGFGAGKEPIPSVLAKYNLIVVASDAPPSVDTVQGWSASNQYSQNVDDLFRADIVERRVFDRLVSWQPVDMNAIPDDLQDFDVCWSACALEHLGSIEQGLQFVKNSLKTLKSGGFAIHTTEFNLTSNTDTLESTGLSIFRKYDIEQLAAELTADGHQVWPLNFHPGNHAIDEIIDLPPYSIPHLKLELSKYVCTSIGLVVRKRLEITDKNFAFLFTPRSGSTLIASDLEWNGIGHSMEIFNSKDHTFNHADFSLLDQDRPFSDYKLIQALYRRNGVFGFKLNYYQFLNLEKYFQLQTKDDILTKLFGKISLIFVKRKNKVKQAISLIRASLSNQWSSLDSVDRAAIENLEALDDSILFDMIFARMAEIQREEYAIELYLTQYFSGQYLEVFYEDYIADRKASIISIAEFLNIQPSDEIKLSTQLEVQANEWSQALAARFEKWLLSEKYMVKSDTGVFVL